MVVVAVAAELTRKVLLGPRLSPGSGVRSAFSSGNGGCARGSRRPVTVVLPLKDRVWRLRIRAWCCHERCHKEEGAAAFVFANAGEVPAARARRGCSHGFRRELEWWLIQARTPTSAVGVAFLTMAQHK